MSIVDARTAHRSYQKPDPANPINADFARLILALDALDLDVHGLILGLAARAPLSHTHAIGQVSGLQAALDQRALVGHTHTLGSLTDVNLSGAANGMLLGRVAGAWQPVAAQWGMSQIVGLLDALAGKADVGSAGAGSIPIGGIIMWSGAINQIPAGWALCNGQNGTPDLRGRFIVGAGGAYAVGNTGGAETVTLTTAQIPAHGHLSGTLSAAAAGSHNHGASTGTAGSHSHSGWTDTQGAHTHGIPITDNSATLVSTFPREFGSFDGASTVPTTTSGAHAHNVGTNPAGDHAHTVTVNFGGEHTHAITGSTANAGSGGAHENRPPFFALAYLMRIA